MIEETDEEIYESFEKSIKSIDTVEGRIREIAKNPPTEMDFISQTTRRFSPKLMSDWLTKIFTFLTPISPNDKSEIYIYEDGIYIPKGEFIINSLMELVCPDVSKNQKTEVITHIRHRTYIDRDKINENPNLIHLNNGIFDIKKYEFMEFDPKIYSLNKLPIDYNPGVECSKIKNFIHDLVSFDDIILIQELFGFCLYRKYFLKRAFMFYGDTDAGKSKLIELFLRFLGKDNCSNQPLQMLDRDRFSAINLYGKMLNYFADLDKSSLYKTGVFKALTGGDRISASQKFKDDFHFTNYAKLLFSCNTLPQTKDTGNAFFNRWEIIHFPNQFIEGKNANPNIIEEITTPEEMSGLFNWSIEGLQRILKQNTFSSSRTKEEIKKQWIMLSDSLKSFVDDMLEKDIDNEITKDELYNIYLDYCNQNELIAKEKNIVGRELPTLINVKTSYPKIEGKQTKCWKGIIFKPAIDKVFEEVENNEEIEEMDMRDGNE